MAKHRQRRQEPKEKDTGAMTLKDGLDSDVLKKLQLAKSEMLKAEEDQKAAEQKRKVEERKQREKNKSFEELLNETDLNWKNFK